MATALKRLAVLLVLFGLATGGAFAQSTGGAGASSFGIGMNLGIGVQSFNEPDPNTGQPVTTTYQSLSLSPDIAFGKFGIGLAITLNYRFTGSTNESGSSFEIRRADWVPDPVDFQSLVALYLPKIAYIRWGLKGDPLFLKLGTFKDATLGDGFIMGDYQNSLFLPGDRHFGVQADMDGNLFQFPYVGFESVVGNLAKLDVLAGRVYARPLLPLSIPILSNLVIGTTYAVDTTPYFGTSSQAKVTSGALAAPTPIGVFGVDAMLPLVFVKDIFSLVTFTDVVSIQGKATGGMLGVGGRLINFITYGTQVRVLGPNFIPVYFGPTYDLLRDQQYDSVMNGGPGDTVMGWQASLGTSFLDGRIVFNVAIDGPFVAPTSDPSGLLTFPHLRGILTLADGVVPGISFDFSYDKKALKTFADLVSPLDAAIQAQLNFKTGPAVISFVYKIIYDPTQTPDPWVVTSGLQSSIQLF